MGFVEVKRPPQTECACKKPSSKSGKYFGPGTIWRCENCGRAWEFVKAKYWYDQRDGDGGHTDEWKRASSHDGRDNRPIPEIPSVDQPSMVRDDKVYGPYGYGSSLGD